MKYMLLVLLISIQSLAIAKGKNEDAIRKVLQEQAGAWNNGDIEGYMKGYWNNDSLLFIGKSGPTYGYNATLARYKTSYSDTTKMGKLNFSDIRFKKLSSKYYYVSGRWALKRTVGDLSGYFTLVFQHIGKKWLIISDHSS